MKTRIITSGTVPAEKIGKMECQILNNPKNRILGQVEKNYASLIVWAENEKTFALAYQGIGQGKYNVSLRELIQN